MSEQRKQNGWLWVIAAILALLMFYPLSLGPMVWLADGNYFSDPVVDVLEQVYEPLIILGEWAPPVGWLLERYVGLFGR